MPTAPSVITDNGHGDGRVKRAPKAKAAQEYVAGGTFPWTPEQLQALLEEKDDVELSFGFDIYDRMLLDPHIWGMHCTVKVAILRRGLSVTPAVKQKVAGEQEPDYDLAAEIAQFVKRQIQRLDRPFVTDVLWDMLDAIATGNRVAELVFEDKEPLDQDAFPLLKKQIGDYPLQLRAVKVKPRRTTAFVVDPYLNVVGLLVLMPGRPYALLGGMLLTSPEQLENLLPRSKFAVLTFGSKDADPRGRAGLRPLYSAWWFKRQVDPEFLAYVAQFARPGLIGTLAENAQEEQEEDPETGELLFDAEGVPVTTGPDTRMETALVNFRGGTYIVIPFGATVKPLEVQGEGAPFLNAYEYLDGQMSTAYLHQKLATSEAQFGTRAQSQTHQDILDTLTEFDRTKVEEFIEREIFLPLVRYNYGEAAEHLVPKASLGDTGEADLAEQLQGLAAVGYTVDASQYPEIDARTGLPPRDPASIEHAQAMQQAALDGMQAKGQPPAPGEPQPPGQQQQDGKQPVGAAGKG
jgi:hypothetical protein